MSATTIRIIVAVLLAIALAVFLFKMLVPILILLGLIGGGVWLYKSFFSKPNP